MENKILKRYPLGNHRFKWRQKDFILSTFSCQAGNMEESFKNHKEAGFNLLELGWASHEQSWEAVELCEKYSIDLLFQDLTICGGMMNHFLNRPVDDDFAKKLYASFKDKKHVIGYYVWDEPWLDTTMARARYEMDELEKADPDALLFVVSMPCYNPPRYNWETNRYLAHLRNFAEILDPPVLSMDYYPIGDYPSGVKQYYYSEEHQLDRDHIWCDLGALRLVGRERNLPIWYYYQGCDLYHCGKLEFSMIRMLMYAGVLYGVKGLQNYRSMEDAVVWMKDGTKGPFFEDQKAIHKEFNALGNTLMAIDNKLVYHSDELEILAENKEELCDSINDSEIFAGPLPKRCSVGEFGDEYGNRYVLVLNRDYHSELDSKIKLKDKYRFYEVSRKDGKQRVTFDSIDTLPVKLGRGDAVLYRVQKADESPFTVEYEI